MITILDLKPGMYVDIDPASFTGEMGELPTGPVRVDDVFIRYFTALKWSWKASEVSKVYTKEEYPEMYL